jgi:hypothetical protein
LGGCLPLGSGGFLAGDSGGPLLGVIPPPGSKGNSLKNISCPSQTSLLARGHQVPPPYVWNGGNESHQESFEEPLCPLLYPAANPAPITGSACSEPPWIPRSPSDTFLDTRHVSATAQVCRCQTPPRAPVLGHSSHVWELTDFCWGSKPRPTSATRAVAQPLGTSPLSPGHLWVEATMVSDP